MLKVIEYLRTHSLSNLENEFNIKIRNHDKYQEVISLTYNQINSPLSEELVRECRGLIINKENLEIIAYPFKKFFNYGEKGAANIDWETAEIEEKLDGTLCVLSYYKGEWNVSTTGTPDASGRVNDYPFTFRELFWNVFNELNYKTDNLDHNKTYMFELMTIYNQLVVQHRENNLLLIGVRDLKTLREEKPYNYSNNFKIAKKFSFDNLNNVLDSIKYIEGAKQEGYVVIDKHFNRIKVKSPEYVRLHHLGTNLSYKTLLELVLKNEGSEFLNYFPKLESMYKEVKGKYDELINEIKQVYEDHKETESQKEFALKIKDLPYQAILFGLRSGRISSIEEGIANLNINKVKDLIDIK